MVQCAIHQSNQAGIARAACQSDRCCKNDHAATSAEDKFQQIHEVLGSGLFMFIDQWPGRQAGFQLRGEGTHIRLHENALV